MGILADRESRLLIDGELVAGSGGTFQTVNPATEEVLGVAADASTEDMGRAIEAARRAFDETGWSTDTELRVRGIRQLQQALRDHADELRELAISEVGAPRMLTSMAQFDGPVEDVFDVQDRITENVVAVVEPHIQQAEIKRSRRERPESAE